jgi:hypothetical protein
VEDRLRSGCFVLAATDVHCCHVTPLPCRLNEICLESQRRHSLHRDTVVLIKVFFVSCCCLLPVGDGSEFQNDHKDTSKFREEKRDRPKFHPRLGD